MGTKTQSRKRENSKRGKEEGGKSEEEWAPSPVHHPSPAKKPLPTREVELMVDKAERWVEEAGWLEEVG